MTYPTANVVFFFYSAKLFQTVEYEGEEVVHPVEHEGLLRSGKYDPHLLSGPGLVFCHHLAAGPAGGGRKAAQLPVLHGGYGDCFHLCTRVG